MNIVTCHDVSMRTCDPIAKIKQLSPGFKLIDTQLMPINLESLTGEAFIIVTYPSIDIKIAYDSLVSISKLIANHKIKCIGVSYDLPFTLRRASTNQELNNITLVSAFLDKGFGAAFGVEILDSPLEGMLSSALFIMNKNHQLVFQEILGDLELAFNLNEIMQILTKI